jgi:hypothetical protein
VLLPIDLLRHADLGELTATFNRQFVEDDDVRRLSLLEQAIAHPALTVEIYPGETVPQELHVYLRVAEISDAPIFACVLAPPEVVRELVSRPPHVVMESASLQFMDSDLSNAAITTAVEGWIRRLWPGARMPSLRLSPWPGPVETGEGALELLRLFPGEASFDSASASPAFSPPPGLVDQQFLPPQQAA